MIRGNMPSSRGRRSAEIAKDESSDTEESSSLNITDNSMHIKSTSTPMRERSTPKVIHDVSRSYQAHSDIDGTEDESKNVGGHQNKFSISRIQNRKESSREWIAENRKKKHVSRRRRRKREEHSDVEDFEEDKRNYVQSDSSIVRKRYGDVELSKKSRKKRNIQGKKEVPITEILKRAQENDERITKYENPTTFPTLTTDKIYIQGRNGFSAVKICGTRGTREVEHEKTVVKERFHEGQSYPPIRIAIIAQKFWKNIGTICQGILAGMGLMHFIMLRIFFNASMEFLASYSMISEIYVNIFLFLATICVVSTFDKFDLARLDVEHLREIYMDYGRAAIAIPLYVTIFSLHQVTARTNDQFAVMRYHNLNNTLWENVTNTVDLLDELNDWEKLTISKDALAVFAWLFISLETKDDAFLIYLESMEKYANDVEVTGR